MTAPTRPRAVIVLSGPMTGLPDYNRPAFRAVAAHLRASGYDVVSPAEYEIQPSATWGECMGVCLDAMREIQAQRLAGDVAPILAVLHHQGKLGVLMTPVPRIVCVHILVTVKWPSRILRMREIIR